MCSGPLDLSPSPWWALLPHPPLLLHRQPPSHFSGPCEAMARKMESDLFFLSLAPSSNHIFPLPLAPPPWVAGFPSLSLSFHSYKLRIAITSLLNTSHCTELPAMHQHAEQRGDSGLAVPLEPALARETVPQPQCLRNQAVGTWPRSSCGSRAQHKVLAFVPHLGCVLSQAQGSLPASPARHTPHTLTTWGSSLPGSVPCSLCLDTSRVPPHHPQGPLPSSSRQL